MSSRPLVRVLLAAVAAGALVAAPLAVTPAEAASSTATVSTWQPRPAQYTQTTTIKDLAIPMSDGVKLRGDLTLPANADGTPIGAKVPVIVTITAYNKTVIAGGFGGTLAGADPAYLVKRGYAQLTVDARGTGSSEGQWNAFDKREDQDSAEVMTWAHQQPWSNGNTAMTGASYMGIAQIFAAAGRPAGLKAIFPQVPAADVYRDVVASGGQIDSGFMPLWLGLVTATSVIPPAVAGTDPQSGIGALASHIGAVGTFTGPTLVKAIAGQDTAYDGPFYAERSPINVISKVNVPTFLVSGEYDLFQRGTPLLFENLRKRGIPTKLIIGPWDHLKGSSGAEVGNAGYGPLNELQLRWFDHYVKGMPDKTLDSDIAPLTYYEQGTDSWKKTSSWVGSDRVASTWKLSGNASNGTPGSLTTGATQDGTATVLPIPVAGLCTRSTNQWTAGIMGQSPLPNPCLDDNRVNDLAGVTFDSAPVTRAVRFQGPINAHLYVDSVGGNGMLSVAVEDVAPDGTVKRLTGGWQVISDRALDTSRSRYLDGKLIQPFHPFTKAAEKPLAAGAVEPVDVEVFPTGASIEPGHKLRIAVQAFDVPHLAPTLPQLLGSLTAITIHSSAKYPSVLTIPAIR
ncbi:CocE/NonD family hydrolase [Marmoricola sp. URHB0036]|uniref:CocE/NonD family hydrolase n=1 Tax=Marmoricola sp. URHB0036 TaxID=1298863 RepID=UPI00041088CD|nr:CocE/NonD family hydrolase [Marmoricola sp. URHB0036]